MIVKKLNALNYATIAHKNDFRKFSNEPYINHPLKVAKNASRFISDSYEVYAAAILHDVLEDTDYKIDHFPEKVRYYVECLTDIDHPDKSTKREINLERWSKIDDVVARSLKLCDIHANLSDSKNAPKSFLHGFKKKCRSLFDIIKYDCNKELINEIEVMLR